MAAVRSFRAMHGVAMFCFALVLAVMLSHPARAEVRWRDGDVTVPTRMDRSELSETVGRLAARAKERRVLVFFDGPVGSSRRDALEAAGVRLLGYLGGHAYFATLAPGVDRDRAAADVGLMQVQAIETRRKLHPELAAGVVRPWAIVEGGKPAAPRVAVYVLFHPDFDLGRAAGLLARHGGEIRSWMRSIHGTVVHVGADRLHALAAEDDVMDVEPPLPQFRPLNDSNRVRIGADELQAAPYDLDGSGVTVLVYDGGKMFAHGDFNGRLTIGASDTSSISDHATHVGGTIGGDGSGSAGQYRGMAPGVDLVSYGFEQEGGLQQGFLYTDPGDIEADYGEAISVYGADISNNSIGTNTASNGYPCEWEGNYGATSALIDAIVGGALGSPFRVVWANGNERSSGACGTAYHTTAPPACGKNHLTVGALHSDSDGVTSFTSWGPCDDGRLKPDVSAPGCQASVDNGVTSSSSSGGYNVKCGTSMASPTVCGVGALLLERYRATFPGASDPRNATLRAILAETAQDIAQPGPDFQSGYGSVRAVAAVDLVTQGRFLEDQVTQGEVRSFLVLVGPGDTELSVTLAWDDPPGSPNVDPVLVNDLDLRVIDPGGTVHHPWTLDPANPTVPAVRTQKDGLNNIEQVVVDAPAPGAYRVEVLGFSVAQGPSQSFGAAASPSLIHCSSAGLLAADKSRIACQATLALDVVDCDLNTDDGITETVTIDLESTSEPTAESLVLTETAPESAAFTGSIGVSATDTPGVLLVAEGDTITATYVDADDGQGGTNVSVTRQVTVDCTSPAITGVSMTDVNPRDATAAITASEPVRLTVRYGTACGALGGTVVRPSLALLHSVRMTGLADDTTYFFRIEAADEAGNAVTDDNGGACYAFTTPEVPDFFTEQFSAGLDLEGLSATFTPNGSTDFYALCTEPLSGGLPTDPAGGTDAGLEDDDLPNSFTLNGGATVALYGQSHSTIHLSPNGYLTFGAGDSTYTETLSQHFSRPRVAALFDDLNPEVGGSVSWKQLADRVAITWLDLPEYGTTNQNTFQIEMFFDGRIRLSWLEIDVSDAIVGLSEGLGLDPDFLETDLSTGADCAPTPPSAQDVARQTAQNVAVAIALPASDDGQPQPLTWRIESLPASGRLTDPGTGAVIAAVPHDLVGGAGTVVYTPHFGHQGSDAFDFRVHDGGTAPEGGSSNLAHVSLTVGGVQTLHEFLVDDTNPGWTATGAWAFGRPTGAGSHDHDPAAGATGLNVYGYNLSGDYPNDMVAETLTTPPLDLSNATGVVVEFQRWLGVDSSTMDDAQFLLTNDGTTYRKIWFHAGGPISESAWSLKSYNVSVFADHRPAVRLRWVMGRTDAAVTYPGWNIDDVRVRGVVGCTAAPGEALDLAFSAGRTSLAWEAPVTTGGTTPYYDVLRSGNATDFVTATVCVESADGADRGATDTASPPPGGLFHYLVRARNACGAGALGATSTGVPRQGTSCP